MAETSFSLNIIINVPMDKLLSFHSNMTNHIQIHPLIQKIELVQEYINPQQQLVSEFKIQDKLILLGFIPYRFYYSAIRTQLNTTLFQFEVRSFPNIQLQTTFEYLAMDAQTAQLKETVSIKAPSLLLNYTKRTAQQAHTTSFNKLKLLLES